MEERNKAIAGCIVFAVLILILGIGGYIYTFGSHKHKTTTQIKEENINKSKMDTEKEFVYFGNENIISSNLGIVYKDAIINLTNSSAKALNNQLANETKEYINSVKKISETENDTGEEIVYDTDDIYSAIIRDYENYEYDNYISLVVVDKNYDCFKGVHGYEKIDSYVFDVKKNEKVSRIDLLGTKEKTLTQIKEEIKAKLEANQTTNDEGEVNIKIEDTLKDIDDDKYALYIDNEGSLIIKYIVKTNNLDYNESMIIE